MPGASRELVNIHVAICSRIVHICRRCAGQIFQQPKYNANTLNDCLFVKQMHFVNYWVQHVVGLMNMAKKSNDASIESPPITSKTFQ